MHDGDADAGRPKHPCADAQARPLGMRGEHDVAASGRAAAVGEPVEQDTLLWGERGMHTPAADHDPPSKKKGEQGVHARQAQEGSQRRSQDRGQGVLLGVAYGERFVVNCTA